MSNLNVAKLKQLYPKNSRNRSPGSGRVRMKSTCAGCRALWARRCELGYPILRLPQKFLPLEKCPKPLTWRAYRLCMEDLTLRLLSHIFPYEEGKDEQLEC